MFLELFELCFLYSGDILNIDMGSNDLHLGISHVLLGLYARIELFGLFNHIFL